MIIVVIIAVIIMMLIMIRSGIGSRVVGSLSPPAFELSSLMIGLPPLAGRGNIIMIMMIMMMNMMMIMMMMMIIMMIMMMNIT